MDWAGLSRRPSSLFFCLLLELYASGLFLFAGLLVQFVPISPVLFELGALRSNVGVVLLCPCLFQSTGDICVEGTVRRSVDNQSPYELPLGTFKVPETTRGVCVAFM